MAWLVSAVQMLNPLRMPGLGRVYLMASGAVFTTALMLGEPNYALGGGHGDHAVAPERGSVAVATHVDLVCGVPAGDQVQNPRWQQGRNTNAGWY